MKDNVKARETALKELAEAKKLAAHSCVVVFDLETTGLDPLTDRILSFSAIKASMKSGILQEQERINLFMNPGFPIPEAASEVNRITDDMVRDAPSEEELIHTVMDFIGDSPVLCGYNSRRFDVKFLQSAFMRVYGEEVPMLDQIDVYVMAKGMDIERHTLGAVAEKLHVNNGISFHTSMDDVVCTLRVLNCFLKNGIK